MLSWSFAVLENKIKYGFVDARVGYSLIGDKSTGIDIANGF